MTAHCVGDPRVWHKIDLVRVADRNAPGGWRYCATYSSINAGINPRPPALAAPRPRLTGTPGWMPTCPTWRSPRSPASVPSIWWLIRSTAHPSSRRPPPGRPTKPGPGKKRWIGPGVTPTPTSAGPHHVSRLGRPAAPRPARHPNRSSTPAGPVMPALTGPAARLPPRHALAALSAHPQRSRQPSAPPVRPSRPAPARLPRGSWRPTATRSPWRTAGSRPGRACGASVLRCSAPACWWPHSNANAKPPVAHYIGPEAEPPRFPSTACAVAASPRPWRSAPMTAHTVGCTVTATSSQLPWRPA